MSPIPGISTDAGPAWVRWSNLAQAVDNTVAAVTVERNRRMFVALASAGTEQPLNSLAPLFAKLEA